MCDQGPALLVNNRAIPRLTPRRIDEICDLIRARSRRSRTGRRIISRSRTTSAAPTCCSARPTSRDRRSCGDRARRAGHAGGDEKVQPARTRRRRLHHRDKWEACRNAAGRRTLCRLQRRRGRARHLQGSRPAAQLCARRVFEGMTIAGLRRRRDARASSICAANTTICGAAGGELAEMRARTPAGHEHPRRAGLQFRHRDPSRRRRLYLRRGIGADRIRWKASPASRASARPSR